MSVRRSDRLTMVEYLDGRLHEDDRVALEMRLAEDPELAAEFTAFERIDLQQRRLALAAPRVRALAPDRRSTLSLAAAVLAALGLAWLCARGAPLHGTRVAVLASGATLRDHNALLPGLSEQDRDKVPPRYALRGSGVEVVSDADYLRFARAAEDRRVAAALADASAAAHSARFLVPFACDADVSVVVLLVTPEGELCGPAGESGRVAFPGDGPWTPAAGRLAGGRAHVLPADVFGGAAGSERVTFQPGFLVPRRTSSLAVIVAWRARPLDDETRRRLESTPPRPAEQWVRTLEGRGFRTATGSVSAD